MLRRNKVQFFQSLTVALGLILALPATLGATTVVPKPAFDPGQLPEMVVQIGKKSVPLPLEHTHVEATLSQGVARVEVSQTYQNQHTSPIEVRYVFPLPNNSAVNAMKMVVGERTIEAQIKEREEARKTYESAKAQGKTASLLEQERPNVFTQSVANIPPGEKIDVVITYVQTIGFDAGKYQFVFPMVVGPRFLSPERGESESEHRAEHRRINPPVMAGLERPGHDISMSLSIYAAEIAESYDVPTHDVRVVRSSGNFLELELESYDKIPNRDFILSYGAATNRPRATILANRNDESGYFSLTLEPPTLDVDSLVGDRELVFVVDVSGSMHGVPLNMCRDAMREALRSMRPGDTFNVLTFAGRTAKLFEGPKQASQANISRAMQFITGLRAGGGTMLGSAVEAALAPRENDGRNRFVFFLTDGYVGREAKIFSMTEKFVETLSERGQRARVFAMGVGSSVNRHLLDGISDAGAGATVYASTRQDPAVAVREYYRLIDHPILENVRVDFGDGQVRNVYPEVMPDLLASRPTVLFGRYASSGSTTVTVRGEHDGELIEYSYEVELPEQSEKHESLPVMWARARVDQLERELWHGPDADVKKTITQLGIDFGLVTAYTSFVAVDSERTVGDGNPEFIDQAVHAPEGVNPQMAGARMLKSRRAYSPRSAPSFKSPAASFSGRSRKQADHLVLAQEGPTASPRVEKLKEKLEEEDDSPRIGCVKRASPEPIAIMAQRVLQQAKPSLPKDFLSLLRERPKYFEQAKARLRIGSDGRVLEVELISTGPLHDRRYRSVRKFFQALRFSPRPNRGEIWIELKLDTPHLR